MAASAERNAMRDKALKKAVKIGATIGALVSLGTAVSMDIVLSDTFQGTWWDAAARDVTRMFGPAWGHNFFAVALLLVLVMVFLAGFGALLGAAGGFIMNIFFKSVLKL